MRKFISIDQNSHPLWDTAPKLHALLGAGLRGVHYLEDVDVAFTRRGAEADDDELAVKPERYYRGGTSDWGATLFYTEFLGRNPLDLPDLEPYTGMTTKALARMLETDVDGLYDRYSPSDNWQMIGASYLDESRRRHRVIGDLTVAETAPLIERVLTIAERDMTDTFPEAAPRKRLRTWFAAERAKMQNLLANRDEQAPLVGLYRDWMATHAPGVEYGLTSDFFAIEQPANHRNPILRMFLDDYELAATLYNEAIAETAVGVNKLSLETGEAPFFLVWREAGRLYRTSANVIDGTMVGDQCRWPLRPTSRGMELPVDEMREAGVCAVVGKALIMVLHVRTGEQAVALALPERGSTYMPAAYALERKLRRHGLLADPAKPVLRVKMNFLESLRKSPTLLRLPPHAADAFGEGELSAAEFAERLPEVVDMAKTNLLKASSPAGRQRLQAEIDPELEAACNELDERRKALARNPETRRQASEIWDELKPLRQRQVEQFVEFIIKRIHVAGLDYFNSRGAILPWSVAVAGDKHYRTLIANAQIYEEKQT